MKTTSENIIKALQKDDELKGDTSTIKETLEAGFTDQAIRTERMIGLMAAGFEHHRLQSDFSIKVMMEGLGLDETKIRPLSNEYEARSKILHEHMKSLELGKKMEPSVGDK